MKIWKTIGLMSGSSLDGLDIAYTEFWEEGNRWFYKLLLGETANYSKEWLGILTNIRSYSSNELMKLHIRYGQLLGENINRFVEKHALYPDIIASHGHTVFHNPAKGYTFQLGDGKTIARTTGILTINDFRSKDIVMGGQGAPLVPIGDQLLFEEYKACINLGGIANISFTRNGQRVACDVGPANQLLNYLAKKLGLEYDKNGKMASEGKLNGELYEKLSKESFYLIPIPRSLSNEYVAENFIPVIESVHAPIKDKLHTCVIHIVDQLHQLLSLSHETEKTSLIPPRAFQKKLGNILVTGGGAKNSFLISTLKDISRYTIEIPDTMLIDFKESLIFSFMGVLKHDKRINCLASATGATKDSSTGVIHLP